MKILITGGSGQLGSELKKIISKGQSEIGKLPQLIKDAHLVSVDIEDLDITDLAAVKKCIFSLSPDVIINCAAFTNVDACETHKDEAFKVNAIGPRTLAMCAQNTGAKLIHISTDYVFAGTAEQPYSEWDICEPQSIYGHTKHLGEQYVREFCTKYFIARTAWLYGHTGNNFVKTIIRAAKERGSLKVVNDQRGNPTNAADLAHHLLKLATSEEYGIYHCTGNGECSWYDFSCEIVRLAKIDCTISPCATEEFPRPAKRPAYSSLENRMLRSTVGDEMRDWKEALAHFINNFNKNGETQ